MFSGCRALGIIGKRVTCPWQRLVGQPGLNILDLNQHFNVALQTMREWSDEPEKLLTADPITIFPTLAVHDDVIFTKLVQSTASDRKCCLFLSKSLKAIVLLLERQLEDQLHGGIFDKPTEDLQNQSISCPATNISGERVFGKLDFNLRRAPNSKLDFQSSKITFSENNTTSWLEQKTEIEQERLISAACRNARESQKLTRKNYENIHQLKINMLIQKQTMAAEKNDRQRLIKENLLEDLVRYGGLWQSISDVHTNLSILRSSCQQTIALKTQIKVRKEILHQEADKVLYTFSKDKRPLKLLELKHNLLQLITPGKDAQEDPEVQKLHSLLRDPSLLEHKYISHNWSNDGVEKRWEGFIHEMVSREPIEYRVDYFGGEADVFLQYDELVADLQGGDLTVLW